MATSKQYSERVDGEKQNQIFFHEIIRTYYTIKKIFSTKIEAKRKLTNTVNSPFKYLVQNWEKHYDKVTPGKLECSYGTVIKTSSSKLSDHSFRSIVVKKCISP